MLIDSSWYFFINIIVVVFVAYIILNGMRRGFILQVVDLLSLVIALGIAFLFAPNLASSFSVISIEPGANTVDLLANHFMNIAVWFVLLVIVGKLVLLLVRPMIKFVSELPIINSVNKLLGAIFGFVVSMMWIIIFTTFLSTPVIKNGKEIIDNTVLKPLDDVAEVTNTFIKNQLAHSKLVEDWIMNLINNDPQAQAEIIDWLVKNKIDINYGN